jgi:translation initiation factor 3 subunit L
MSYDDRVNARPSLNDESDVEEEALVNDYREQVNFEDGMSDLDRTTSLGGSQAQDLQAQLTAAATPLEYQATLETKFASYDNYCSLFHYILNSEGPVDLEVPSVGAPLCHFIAWWSDKQ